MAFFKKLKYISKHKKLTEEWALATDLKDLSGSEDEIVDDDSEPEMFLVKYLGNTNIESARSEEATAEAVNAIISTAKATNKKLQRINLCVSPKGIEILDPITLEAIKQISIYKISYCSADAVHGNVFAFVCTEDLELDQPSDTLMCYAFLCQKRKYTQKVTLAVARCFEMANQIWHEAVERKEYLLERRHRSSVRSIESNDHNDDVRNLLIDFSSEITAEICNNRNHHTQLLQNTWVSFDDEQPQQQHGCNLTSARLHDSSSNRWEKNLINCS